MNLQLNHHFSYGLVDLSIILGAGLVFVIPMLLGYAVLTMIAWHWIKKVWNLLWEGMDEERRVEYTTITFKTEKW